MALARGRRRWLGALALAVACAAALAALAPSPPPAVPRLADLPGDAAAGEYLARAGNCMACHTAEGGAPWAGGRALATPFGTLYSTNLTPDPTTGIGRWTFADFVRAMREGRRPDGSHLYPAFPYDHFARLTDADLAALWRFLRTLPPLEQAAREPELRFPYGERRLVALWKALFHDPRPFTPDPARSALWNRGAYLVEGIAHCGACHTPRNLLGAERRGAAFAGGTFLDRTRLGHFRRWSAPNLTPDPAGLAGWSEEEIVAYLKSGVSRRQVVHGPMREVVMHGTSHLREEDLRAIAVYLKSLPPRPVPRGKAPDDATLAAGEVVYTVHCATCHMADGQGEEGLGVPLVGSATVRAADPSTLINVVLYGPHLPPGLEVDRSPMKMFGKRLSDDDIAAVLSYVRDRFGDGAGAVTAEEVARQR